MKLTIIPIDGVVGVDGVFRSVSMAGMDAAIHAAHFDDATGEGEIEFRQKGLMPERITDRAQFIAFVNRWVAAEPPPPPPPPPPVKQLTVDSLAAALKAKGILSDSDITAAKV